MLRCLRTSHMESNALGRALNPPYFSAFFSPETCPKICTALGDPKSLCLRQGAGRWGRRPAPSLSCRRRFPWPLRMPGGRNSDDRIARGCGSLSHCQHLSAKARGEFLVVRKSGAAYDARMDEGRKRVLGIIAGIKASAGMRHLLDLNGRASRSSGDLR